MAVSQLYNGVTGALIGPVDEGDGLRQKSWLAEITKYAQEAAEAGYGRAVNFPGHYHGEQMGHQLIGDAAYVSPSYAGTVLFEAVHQRLILATGDATVTDFGGEDLTEASPVHANYHSTPSDPDSLPEPRGAQFAPYIQSIVDGGGVDCSAAGNNILTLIVNGTTYAITLEAAGGLATTLAEDLRESIIKAGVPVTVVVQTLVSERVRIWAPGLGRCNSIQVVNSGAGALWFTGAGASAAAGTVYYGGGGPLNQRDDTGTVNGGKPQRAILPGSLTVTTTMGGVTITATDTHDGGTLRTGTISGSNAAGTITITGTINYATGAIDIDTAGDAPDNATNVQVDYDVLVPIDLEKPTRISPNAGRSYALINN